MSDNNICHRTGLPHSYWPQGNCQYCGEVSPVLASLSSELDRLREENALLVGEVSDLKYRLSYANESLSHRTEIIHNVWDALGNPTLVQNEGRTVSECVSHAVRTRDGEISRLREAIIEACDLLMERKQGSPSRSPSHNARLRLEEAIGHWNGRALSPDNPTQKKEGEI